MFKTLYAKLALALALLLIALGAVYGLFALYTTGVFLQELDQRFNRNLARQLLVQRNLGSQTRLDEASVKALFSHYMHINPAIEIYLLDRDGRILAFEAPQMRIKRERVDVAPIHRFLSDTAPLPILGDDPRDTHRRKVFSAAPIPLEGSARQYLYVILGGEAYDSVRALLRESYFGEITLAGAAAILVFGLLTGTLVFHLLTRRLRRLSEVMDRFRASGFREHRPYAPETSDNDEVDRLGGAFDAMAGRIIGQVDALEHQDSLRRNLVANVSHDLRTPLAALQGYLETLMMKSEGMDEDERQRQLATAFRQSERLTRLVNELFELSKLEAHEVQPDFEPLAWGELVHDVAQKFRLRTEQRGITLEVEAPPDLPLLEGDVAMLDRVMDNLLENALRHTPEGGRVKVRVTASDDALETAVLNTGPAIPAEAVPHLFERFYRSPDRRGAGAGLGLAIVKRITELHGGGIEVDRTAAEETRFRFSLPLRR